MQIYKALSYFSFSFSVIVGLVLPVSAQTIGDAGKSRVTVIAPQKEPEQAKTAKIDTERYEFGPYYGFLSIEDFNTVSLLGLSINYHFGERWMTGIRYANTSAPTAEFDESFDAPSFLADPESGLTYLAAIASFELLEGRSFWGKKRKMSSHIYLDFGLESVDFNATSNVGFLLGMNYKMVVTDWLTLDLAFRDHIFERTFLDETKLTQNLESSLGFNFLF